MFNDELNEKKMKDLCENTIVKVKLTIDQASDIYACLIACADRFESAGLLRKAEQLKTLAEYLVAKSALSILDK